MITNGIDLSDTNSKAVLVHKTDGYVDAISLPTHADILIDYVFERILHRP